MTAGEKGKPTTELGLMGEASVVGLEQIFSISFYSLTHRCQCSIFELAPPFTATCFWRHREGHTKRRTLKKRFTKEGNGSRNQLEQIG